jgi:hypothetical protein
MLSGTLHPCPQEQQSRQTARRAGVRGLAVLRPCCTQRGKFSNECHPPIVTVRTSAKVNAGDLQEEVLPNNWLVMLLSSGRDTEQHLASSELSLPPAAAEDAVIADLAESLRQHVQQEAPQDEFADRITILSVSRVESEGDGSASELLAPTLQQRNRVSDFCIP